MTYFQFTINRSGLRFFTILCCCSLTVLVVVVVFSACSRCCCIPYICVRLQHGNRKQNKSLTPDSKCFYAKRTAHSMPTYCIHSIRYFCNCTRNSSKSIPFSFVWSNKMFNQMACTWLRFAQFKWQPSIQCIPLIDCSHHIHQSIVSFVTRGDVCTLLLMNKLDWHFA